MLYHYTTTNALSLILREDGVCLMATHYKHLNDPNENKWCQTDLRNLCTEIKGMSDKDFNLYENFPYTISFCNTSDDLTMWRLYGDNGNGVILCFNKKEIERSTDKTPDKLLMKVSYANEKNKQKKFENTLEMFRSKLSCDNDPTEDCFGACTFIKKKDYAVEKEVRYVIIRENNFHASVNFGIKPEEELKNVKYRMRNSELVPYIEQIFKPQSLKKIIVGYNLDFEKAKKSIMKILHQYENQYKDVEIVQSKHNK